MEINKKLSNRFYKIWTACICSYKKDINVINYKIKAVWENKIFWIAYTVKCDWDYLTVLKGLYEAKENEILIVDTWNKNIAIAWDILSTEAIRKWLAWIITNWWVRDTDWIRKLWLPVYSQFIYPHVSKWEKIFETQIEIEIWWVNINPWDVIFWDSDWVVVISKKDDLNDLLIWAENIYKKEENVLERIKKWENLIGDITNFKTHYDKISKWQTSTFKLLK